MLRAKNLMLILPRSGYENYFSFTKLQLDTAEDHEAWFICEKDWVDFFIERNICV